MRETFETRYAERAEAGPGRLAAFLWRTSFDMLASGLRERSRPSDRRDFRQRPSLDSTLLDARFALRMLRRSPGFSAVIVLTLGLGIGGATALFSVVDGVLLRPLPYPEPERLVQLWQVNDPAARAQFSEPNFRDVQERSRSFEALAAYGASVSPLSIAGEARRVSVAQTSERFFDVLGVRPVVGRLLEPAEVSAGAAVMVVDEDFWRANLGASADLSRYTPRIGERTYAIVGVLPSGAAYPTGTTAWIPREPRPAGARTAHNWRVVGRLRPGVGLSAVRAELSGIAADLSREYGDDTWMLDAAVVPLREQLVGPVRRTLLILLAASGFLLLVACANVVNLLLARAASRGPELATRRAIGAGLRRLAAQFLVEALVLSALGGALGVVLARIGVVSLLALEPGRLPRTESVGVSGAVLLFALALSFGVAAVLALLTSMRTSQGAIAEALTESGRSRLDSRRGHRMRNALTAAQVAMTLVLLVGAGLLARSFLTLSSVDPGYRTQGALVVDAYLPGAVVGDPFGPSQEAADRLTRVGLTRDALVARMRALPGVTAVGVTTLLPLTGGGSDGEFLIVDRADDVLSLDDFVRLAKDPDRLGYAEYRVASAGYFRAMGIPLESGRLFDDRDGPTDPVAAVISRSLADVRWPGEDPVGKVIEYGNMDGDLRPYTVVGVVGDVREGSLDAEHRPTFYGNALQRPAALRTRFSLVLATSDADGLVPAARAAARDVAPDVPVRIRTLSEVFSASLAQRRFSLILLGAFAALAVALAITGIYGVISYLVAQRSREWAVRLALGARRSDVLRRVLTRGAWLVGTGVLVGTLVALAATRVLRSFLYEVSPTDATTFVAVALLLAAVSLAASYVPAVRATRVDPAAVMRE